MMAVLPPFYIHWPQKHISQSNVENKIYWKLELGLCTPIPVCFHVYFGVPLPAFFFFFFSTLTPTWIPPPRGKEKARDLQGFWISFFTKVLSCPFPFCFFDPFLNCLHLHMAWFFCCLSDPPLEADQMLCFDHHPEFSSVRWASLMKDSHWLAEAITLSLSTFRW